MFYKTECKFSIDIADCKEVLAITDDFFNALKLTSIWHKVARDWYTKEPVSLDLGNVPIKSLIESLRVRNKMPYF